MSGVGGEGPFPPTYRVSSVQMVLDSSSLEIG